MGFITKLEYAAEHPDRILPYLRHRLHAVRPDTDGPFVVDFGAFDVGVDPTDTGLERDLATSQSKESLFVDAYRRVLADVERLQDRPTRSTSMR